MYHACDSHGYCIYDYNTLQLSDFFSSVVSVWFTLVAMLKMRSIWQQTLNITAVFAIFVGVQLSRFGVLILAIPGGLGLMFVLLSFVSTAFFYAICNYTPVFLLIALLIGSPPPPRIQFRTYTSDMHALLTQCKVYSKSCLYFGSESMLLSATNCCSFEMLQCFHCCEFL